MLFLFIQAYKERLLQITNCVQQIQTISITNLLSDCKPKCKTISILSYKYNENKKKTLCDNPICDIKLMQHKQQEIEHFLEYKFEHLINNNRDIKYHIN